MIKFTLIRAFIFFLFIIVIKGFYLSRSRIFKSAVLLSTYNGNENNQPREQLGMPEKQGMMPQRSSTPSRHDVCKIFISGFIGTEPKETYLSNGHYVVNVAIATVGHFQPVHDWEKYKPAESMWLSAEIWDAEAKKSLEMGLLKKGLD